MKISNLICIDPQVRENLSGRIQSILELASKEFSHYQFDYKSPYMWWESVPNPNYNPGKIPPDDEDVFEYRTAVCGFDMQLKKVTHSNFNIKCFLYQDKIYIYPGVYYYAQFNAYKLKSLIEALFMSDSFTFGNQVIYDSKSYKQWVDSHLDQKWAQHNYKIDKEDLFKIGIEV